MLKDFSYPRFSFIILGVILQFSRENNFFFCYIILIRINPIEMSIFDNICLVDYSFSLKRANKM